MTSKRVQRIASLLIAYFTPYYRRKPQGVCAMSNCNKPASIGLVWKSEIKENREYPVWVCQDCYDEMVSIVEREVKK